ncbi:uncharacterized protein LOC132932060 [Rhopalosiphum padi]|uniref:uncharacterized protein LOC132932060 n=1 Tax=Rhopalosiphum padi TaxID=40932 RepID=UPI00298DFE84|nr:uncharacterized protein LOC132932060 [Rhopalosiphum padi]
MNEMNIKTTHYEKFFSKKKFFASLGLMKKEKIKKIVEFNKKKKNKRITRSGAVYNNISSKTTKAKKKTNEKIQNKHLIQQNFEKSEVEQQQIKNIKTNVKKQPKKKSKSLKLNVQKSITYKPITSMVNEVNETIKLKIIPPQRKLKSIAGPGLLTKEKSKEENENVISILHKKNEIHSKVIMIANEDNTKQTNHEQSTSDTTYLIIPKLWIWTFYDNLIKLQRALTMNLVKHACIPMTYDPTVTDGLDLKWMSELYSILLLNKKLDTIQYQLRGIQKNHNSLLQKIGVSKYQWISDKNINLDKFLDWLSRKFKKMKISIIIELNKYYDNKIRTIENEKPNLKNLENMKSTAHGYINFKSHKKKRFLTNVSVPLMTITAPIEKKLVNCGVVDEERR